MKLLLVLIIIIIIIISFINIINSQPYTFSDFGLLNDYLNGRRIGYYAYRLADDIPSGYDGPEGFCSDLKSVGANPLSKTPAEPVCYIDFATIPDSVKNIQVDFGDVLDANVGVQTIGSLLPESIFQTWYLECQDFEIGNLEIPSSLQQINSTHATIKIKVNAVKFDCMTRFYLKNINLQVAEIDIDDSNIGLEKSQQTTGTDVSMTIILKAPDGSDLSNSFPTELFIPVENIELSLDAGITFYDSDAQGDQLVISLIGGLVTLGSFAQQATEITDLLLPVIEILAADIISQFAQLEDGPGILSDRLAEVTDTVEGWKVEAQPDIQYYDELVELELTEEQLENTYNFAINSGFAAVSIAINQWLGAISTSKGYEGKLVIDEVIDLILGNQNGTVELNDFTGAGAKISFDLLLVTLEMELTNLTATGINSFENFRALDNYFEDQYSVSDRHNYTLEHRITLAEAFGTVGIKLTFKDGKYISNSFTGVDFDITGVEQAIDDADDIEVNLEYQIGVKNLDIDAATLIAINPSVWYDRQFGQLLGGNEDLFFDQLVHSLKCAKVDSLYLLNLTSLKVSIDEIIEPELLTFPDEALKEIVNNATTLGLAIAQSAIETNLEVITQFGIRPLANKLIKNRIIDKKFDCETYSRPSSNANIFNFETSNLFSIGERIINNVVGGSPVSDTAADINDIFDLAINFTVDILDLPSSTPKEGAWIFEPDVKIFGGISAPVDDARVRFRSVSFENTDSVHKLLMSATSDSSFHFEFAIGDGYLKNPETGNVDIYRGPLKIGIRSHYYVEYPSKPKVNEDFEIILTLSNVTVSADIMAQVDLYSFHELTVKDLLRLDCFLAIFEDGYVGPIDIGIEALDFEMVRNVELPGSDLHDALNALNNEFQTVSQARFNALTDYVFYSFSQIFARVINNHDFENDDTVDTCTDINEGFSSTLYRLARDALDGNITEMIIRNTGPQPDVLDAFDLDDLVILGDDPSYLDWDDSFLGSIVDDIITGLSADEMAEILQVFGNTTGDPLSDAFITEDDLSITLKVPLADLGLNISLDGLIDGGRVIGGFFILTNIDKIEWDTLRIAEPISTFVTNNYLSFPADMHVYFNFTILAPGEFLGETEDVTDMIEISMDISDLLVEVQLVLALNWNFIRTLSVGHFLFVDAGQIFELNSEAVNCFFSSFFENGFYFPKLVFDVSSVENFQFQSDNGIVSNGVELVVTAVLNIFFDLYIRDLKYITQGLIRNFINDYFLIPRVEDPGTCLDPIPPPLPESAEVLNFELSNTVSVVQKFTSVYLAGNDGKYDILNGILDSLFGGGKVFLKNGFGLNRTLSYGSEYIGDFRVFSKKYKFNGIGTFNELSIMNPTSAYSVSSNFSATGPMEIKSELIVSIDDFFLTDTDEPIREELGFTITIEDLRIYTDINIRLNIPEFLEINAGSLTNISQIACVLRAVEKLSLRDLDISIGGLGAEVECIGVCNSPLTAQLEIGSSAGTEDKEDREALAELVSNLLKLVTSFLNSEDFQDQLDESVDQSDANCQLALDLSTVEAIFNPEEENVEDIALIFGLGAVGFFGAVFLISFLLVPRHLSKKKRYFEEALQHYQTEPGSTPESVASAMLKEERYMVSLARHPNIPLYVKIGVPIFILTNIVFLILAIAVVPSFTIDVSFKVVGSVSKEIQLVPFSIRSMTNDMWNSGAWPIAFLIAGASCMWPIIKNSLLFFYWFAPTTLVTKPAKEHALEILDILGKWSLVDVYIVVLLIAAMKIYVAASMANQLAFVPEDLLAIDNTATPMPGIILLSIAAGGSLAINHIIIYWDKRASFEDKRMFKALDQLDDDMRSPKARIKVKLCDYVFSTTNQNKQRDRYGIKGKNLLIMLLVSSFLLTTIVLFLPLFGFLYNGVLGLGLSLVDKDKFSKIEYSLFTVGSSMTRAAKTDALSWIAIIFFQILYFISVLVAPLMQPLLFLFLWIYPLNHFEAETVYMFANIAGYWASIDVFLVSVMAMAIEVEPVTKYILDVITGNTCGAAQPYLVELLGKEDGACLNVVCDIYFAWYVALIIFFYNLIINGIGQRACKIAMRDREYILEGVDPSERKRFSRWEYLVANQLFPHGAAHHKPLPKPKKVKKPKKKKEKKQKKKKDASGGGKWNVGNDYNAIQGVGFDNNNNGMIPQNYQPAPQGNYQPAPVGDYTSNGPTYSQQYGTSPISGDFSGGFSTNSNSMEQGQTNYYPANFEQQNAKVDIGGGGGDVDV